MVHMQLREKRAQRADQRRFEQTASNKVRHFLMTAVLLGSVNNDHARSCQ